MHKIFHCGIPRLGYYCFLFIVLACVCLPTYHTSEELFPTLLWKKDKIKMSVKKTAGRQSMIHTKGFTLEAGNLPILSATFKKIASFFRVKFFFLNTSISLSLKSVQ
jgi:hypothetical protein